MKLLASFAESAKQALENAVKIFILVLACIAVAFTYLGLLFMSFILILFILSICLLYDAQFQLIGLISFNIIKDNRTVNFSIIIVWEYFSIVDLELPSIKISIGSGEIKGELTTNLLLDHEKYMLDYPKENNQSQNNDTTIEKNFNEEAVAVGFIMSFLLGIVPLILLNAYTPDNIYYYIALGAYSIIICFGLLSYGILSVQNDPESYGVFLGMAIGLGLLAIMAIVSGILLIITRGIEHKTMEKIEKILSIILVIFFILAAIIIGAYFIWFKDLYPIIDLVIDIIMNFWEILGLIFSIISFLKIGRRVERPGWKKIVSILVCIGGAYLVFAIIFAIQFFSYKN
ncbi:MAG: hypothetical protein ACTSYZ_06390 [Candidatus Helarchaeota archaeon]